eukprot:c6484_g1_i1.p2 GENE.c6484_g1_i1~~c6484_g1_i1.p2  ORF type:complete len:110 (-),score=32.77 c6484_g1_i1:161-490(-)
MYDILTRPVILSGKTKAKVIVACNKQDASAPLTTSFIKRALEKEIDRLRKTRATLQYQEGDSSEQSVFLGIEGEAFSFAHAPCEVDFVACSAKTNTLTDLTSLIQGHIY